MTRSGKVMSKASVPAQRPIEEVAAARAFYSGIGQDVRYFSALWHTFSVGHMLTKDLDRICRQFGLSIADFCLMGALRIDRTKPLRATDLAVTLQVSNGALTARVAKLGDKGLLTKSPVPGDARAFTLQLSPEGAAIVEAIHSAVARESHFVSEVYRLPDADRKALERIMGELHCQLDRFSIHAHR
jgi:DNA-binding MarR family transcriptional regulator